MNQDNQSVAFVKKIRLICNDCWLLQGGFAGQMITGWSCEKCGGIHNSGSTATPKICKGCALATGLCEDCGVKQHLYQEQK